MFFQGCAPVLSAGLGAREVDGGHGQACLPLDLPAHDGDARQEGVEAVHDLARRRLAPLGLRAGEREGEG